MDVAIVGPGRLGRTLAELLEAGGHTVSICGRGATVPMASLTLLTVPDAAIRGVAAALAPRSSPVLHCSGALGTDVLRPHRPAGSFHPLMTFPGPERGLPDLAGVPAAVAGDPQAVLAARELAAALGMRAFDAPTNRLLYHAAAVISGNFATVLLAHAARTLAAAGVPVEDAGELLVPLAIQSLRNASRDPIGSLTGPAARGDRDIITAHRAALHAAALPDTAKVYDALTTAAVALLDVRNTTSGQVQYNDDEAS